MTVLRRTHEAASLAVALLLLAVGVYGVGWGDFTSGAFFLTLGALVVLYAIAAAERRAIPAGYGGGFLLVGTVGLAQGALELDNDLPLAAVDLAFGLAAVGAGVHVLRVRPAR